MEWRSESERPELVAVMPTYNEEANIAAVVGEWFACLTRVTPDFLLLAVNDGSSDKTAEILSTLSSRYGNRLRVVTKENSGHGRTCRHGYELALDENAKWIFQIDSDGQCDPAYFEDFYNNRSRYDCLFGYRQSRDDGYGRVLISLFCRILVWATTGNYLKDPNVPYRLIRANALRSALRSIPPDFDLQNIALTFLLRREPTVRWKHFPIHFRARQGGQNSINYRKIVEMGINLLRDLSRITHEDSHTWWRPNWARRRMAS